MNIAIIQGIIGRFLMLFSLSSLPPLLVDLLYHENTVLTFSYSFLLLLGFGFLLYFPVRKQRKEL
jgi:trk system potassium uptake protein TrkH